MTVQLNVTVLTQPQEDRIRTLERQNREAIPWFVQQLVGMNLKLDKIQNQLFDLSSRIDHLAQDVAQLKKKRSRDPEDESTHLAKRISGVTPKEWADSVFSAEET